MQRDEIVEVDVVCPECGNMNRAARRACRNCGRTGFVKKNMPVSQVVTPADPNMEVKDASPGW